MRDRIQINGRGCRVTPVMRDVLAAVVDAKAPPWALEVCEATGHESGGVCLALDELLDAGLIRDWWAPARSRMPEHRYYFPAFGSPWYRANGLLPERAS